MFILLSKFQLIEIISTVYEIGFTNG